MSLNLGRMGLVCLCAGLGCASLAFADERESYAQLVSASERGSSADAARQALSFVQRYPQSDRLAGVELILGKSLYEQGQYREALERLQVARQKAQGSNFADEILYWEGEAYFKSGDYPRAIARFEELLKNFPRSSLAPHAYHSQAWSVAESGGLEEAVQILDQTAVSYPDHPIVPDCLWDAAQIEFRLEQYRKVLDRLNDFIRRYPLHVRMNEVYYLKGQALLACGDYLGSADAFKKVIQKDPKGDLEWSALIGLGSSLFESQKYEDSLQVFSPLSFEGASDSVQSHLLLGKARSLDHLGRTAEAKEIYIRRSALSDENADDALFWLGELYYAEEDFAQASASWRSLVTRFPQSPLLDRALYSLGWASLKEEQYSQALEFFESVVKKTSDLKLKVNALCQMGDYYLEHEDFDKASAYYDEVLRDYPLVPGADYAQFQMANVLWKRENFEGALLAFRSLGTNYPSSEWRDDARYGESACYAKQGNYEQALAIAEEFAIQFPESELRRRAYFQKGMCLVHFKRWDEALKVFGDIVSEKRSEDRLGVAAIFQEGLIQIQKGDDAAAVKAFETLVRDFPQDPLAAQSYLELGRHSAELGRYEEAVGYYSEMVRLFPKGEYADDALWEWAQGLRRQQKIDEAAGILDRLIREYPESNRTSSAIDAITDIFIGQGQSDVVGRKLLQYQGLFKEGSQAASVFHWRLGVCLKDEGRFREALDFLARALNGADPASGARIQFEIADIYRLQNRTEECSAEFLKIPYLYPRETLVIAKARYQAALVWLKAGKKSDAKRLLEEVAAGAGPEAELAKVELSKL